MLAERVQEWTRTWVEQRLEQGRQEGRQEGRVEGRAEGLREGAIILLRRQLEARFGPLPEPLAERIEAATSDERLRWGERVLHATTLDEVFAD